MKSDHQFKVERVLARHCDALIARGPAPREPKDVVQEFTLAASTQLGRSMGQLLGGKPCKISSGEVGEGSLSSWRESLPTVSKVLALSGPAGRPEILISIDMASAISLTDIAFGGTGAIPKTMPEEWPSACVSVAETLGSLAANALAQALEYPAPLNAVASWSDSAKAGFLCGANELYWTHFKSADAADGNWSVALALPARHAKIVDGGASAMSDEGSAKSIHPSRAPHGGIPLEARCELTQLRLPINRAAQLKPGDIFPIAIPREVPITIAGRDIARGAIGTLDDCVAFEITRLGQA